MNIRRVVSGLVVAVDGSEIFPGLCRSGYLEKY